MAIGNSRSAIDVIFLWNVRTNGKVEEGRKRGVKGDSLDKVLTPPNLDRGSSHRVVMRFTRVNEVYGAIV